MRLIKGAWASKVFIFGVLILCCWLNLSHGRAKSASLSWTVRDLNPELQALSQEIRFLKPAPEGEGGLLQAANTSVTLFAELPPLFYLQAEQKAKRKTKALVKIISPQGKELKHFRLKSRVALLPVKLEQGGIYSLTFLTQGPADGYVLWKNLYLLVPEKELPPAERPASHLSPPSEDKIFFPSSKSSEVYRPDIFLYVIDALRPDHLGCYGYERKTSPQIDRFAQEAALYLRAYANSSWTRASAASILSGLRPKNHRTIGRNDVFSSDIITLPEILQKIGYETIAVVANGNIHPVYGFAQGFDDFKYLGLVKSSRVQEEIAKILSRRAKMPQRQPLFLFIWTIDPHDPYEPESKDSKLFSAEEFEALPSVEGNLLITIRDGGIKLTPSQKLRLEALYDQEIYGNDRSFGRLIDLLKANKLYDRSIIILTADHGEQLFDHGSVGHGFNLYEEQIRVPLIIKAPFISPGKYKTRVQHIDLFPTILSSLGLERLDYLPGISLLDLKEEGRPLYFELNLDGHDLTALLEGQKKIIYAHRKTGDQASKPYWELFDEADRAELLPLAPESMEEKYLQQKVLIYRHLITSSSPEAAQQRQIPERLREHLRTLGYIK